MNIAIRLLLFAYKNWNLDLSVASSTSYTSAVHDIIQLWGMCIIGKEMYMWVLRCFICGHVHQFMWRWWITVPSCWLEKLKIHSLNLLCPWLFITVTAAGMEMGTWI